MQLTILHSPHPLPHLYHQMKQVYWASLQQWEMYENSDILRVVQNFWFSDDFQSYIFEPSNFADGQEAP